MESLALVIRGLLGPAMSQGLPNQTVMTFPVNLPSFRLPMAPSYFCEMRLRGLVTPNLRNVALGTPVFSAKLTHMLGSMYELHTSALTPGSDGDFAVAL